eukprot:TRINITY_DN1340_c0_g1_i1.p1 TRINITY_DN1340_c0_g1~~TRINITY_DN1340_c0_g1_i1.p1  ORF type:complete len:248 (+),score=34.00 TRINITY_DN1340_c0_g1_i1:131-874(+)
MARLEYISPEGLRLDGRRPEEMRKVTCQMGVLARADGSASFRQGNTIAIASVYGPHEITRRRNEIHDRAFVTCQYTMASFSTGDRKGKSKGDRRAMEISLVIRNTFEAAIMTKLYPRSQIDIHIQIIQADGGTRCAGINAATLALIDAGIPLKDFVISAAAGYISGTPILDLNYVEDSAGGPDLPVAILPKSDKVVMCQMDSKLPIDMFEKVIKLAIEGCHMIYGVMCQEVKRRAQTLSESRGVVAT